MPAGLLLTVEQFTDIAAWRWRLTEDDGKDGGKLLATAQAKLDTTDPRYAGWLDLPRYLENRAAPDRRATEEPQLLRDFGDWLSAGIFGDGMAEKLLDYAPATVRIKLPDAASDLALRPLEAARLGGKTLLQAGLVPVFVMASARPKPQEAPVGKALRVLAVFSLPPRQSPLNLRQERQALRRLVAELQGSGKRANIELRILQYGATRATLQAALEDGDGWDVAHFSCHGDPGALVLEGDNGADDVISADDLAELLKPHRDRLKLATLSACHSGAAAIEERLKTLNIHPNRDGAARAAASDAAKTDPAAASSLAQKLAEHLDCAVLAMRFSVGDRFAIELAKDLYRQMWDKRADLPTALVRAAAAAAAGAAGDCLAVVTPALFGGRAAGLKLTPPGGYEHAAAGPFAHLPREADVFVGRVGVLTRAGMALSSDSRKAGVALHGMAGAGKTACAAELAHHMRLSGRFLDAVWWKAPDQGAETAGSLADFALSFDSQLAEHGFSLAAAVHDDDKLAAKLPALRQFLRDRSILIVLDNLESLLWDDGRWRDPRFGRVLAVLCDHGGLSRVALTSRVLPADPPKALIVEPLHALSVREAMLVLAASEDGRRLLNGGAAARTMARRLLDVTQGHPKLLELGLAAAKLAAGDMTALAGRLDAAEQAWRDGESLSAFFATGESTVSDRGFIEQLAGWTTATVARLPAAAQTLFHVLAAMEEPDREAWLLAALWPHVWREVGAGEAPALPPLLDRLTEAALIEPQAAGEDEEALVSWRLHPGVAAAARDKAPDGLCAAVDRHMGGIWRAVLQMGLENENQRAGEMIRRAGFAAAPYLLRAQQGGAAGWALERVLLRDQSPAVSAAALPLLRRAADEATGADSLAARGRLARALWLAGEVKAAETEMRGLIDQAAAAGEYHMASAVAGDLLNLLQDAGRLTEALTLAEEKAGHTVRAGLGPWTRLGDAAQKLRIMVKRGDYAAVLKEVERHRQTMRELPEASDAPEAAVAWNVRETLLDVGRSAALHSERWQAALDFNHDQAASKRTRGAPPTERARTRFNAYGPLLRLGRLDEAATLLDECRGVFTQARDWLALGAVLTAQAALANQRGRPIEAAGLARAALRYKYAAAGPEDCAISHNNLANYLIKSGAAPAAALAHRLAANLIGALMGSGHAQEFLRNLALDIRDLGVTDVGAAMPGSVDEVIRLAEAEEGVRLQDLLAALNRDGVDLDELLQAVTAAAFEAAAEEEGAT